MGDHVIPGVRVPPRRRGRTRGPDTFCSGSGGTVVRVALRKVGGGVLAAVPRPSGAGARARPGVRVRPGRGRSGGSPTVQCSPSTAPGRPGVRGRQRSPAGWRPSMPFTGALLWTGGRRRRRAGAWRSPHDRYAPDRGRGVSPTLAEPGTAGWRRCRVGERIRGAGLAGVGRRRGSRPRRAGWHRLLRWPVQGKHAGLAQRGLGAVSVGTGEPVPEVRCRHRPPCLRPGGRRRAAVPRREVHLLVDGEPRSNAGVRDAWRTARSTPGTPRRPAAGATSSGTCWSDDGTVFSVGRNAGAVVAHDAVTAPRRQWRTTANGDAQALALEDGLLYAGGHFVEIGQPRPAPEDRGGARPHDRGGRPRLRAPVRHHVFPVSGRSTPPTRHLYVGGYFTGAGPRRQRRFPSLTADVLLIREAGPAALVDAR